MLYPRKDAVGRGVGRRLYRAVEREARGLGLRRIFTEADRSSICALLPSEY